MLPDHSGLFSDQDEHQGVGSNWCLNDDRERDIQPPLPQVASQQQSSHVTENVEEFGQARGRCSECGKGNDVEETNLELLQEAKNAMCPGNKIRMKGVDIDMEWDANGCLLYCFPTGVLEKDDREQFRVAFRKCGCHHPLWAMKFGVGARYWGGFVAQNCCKNNFHARVREKEQARRVREKGQEKLFSVDDTESLVGEKRKGAPDGEQQRAPEGAASGPPQFPPHRTQQTTEYLLPQSPLGLFESPRAGPHLPQLILQPIASENARQPTRTQAAESADMNVPAPELGAVEQEKARQFSLDLKQALSDYCWTAKVLYFFFETQKEKLKHQAFSSYLPAIKKAISKTCKSPREKQDRANDTFTIIELALSEVKGKKAPLTVDREELSTVKNVMNFTIKNLLKFDGFFGLLWDTILVASNDQTACEFAQEFEEFFETLPWDHYSRALLPSSSLGVFFRMPSWLVRLVLFIFKHNTTVQCKLMGQGYRSFAYVGGVTPQDRDPVQDGEEQVHYSIICGYNIRECPAWVGDGIPFEGHIITQDHRDIVERLSHEYHQRFEAYQKEGEEGWGEEEEEVVVEEEEMEEMEEEEREEAIVSMLPLGQKKGLDSETVGAAVEGAVAVLKEREFVTIHAALSTCRQSEGEARDHFDKETYDMLFNAPTVLCKGVGVGTRSTRSGTRGGGASRGGQSEEKVVVKEVVKEVLEDLHDFRDENGVWTSDWVLQVTVKQHDDKDDEDGQRISASKVSMGADFRLYQEMEPEKLIRVSLRNLSRTRDISVMPVYVKENGEEEAEELVEIKAGDCFELPFPLQKKTQEKEDGWVIKDKEGKTVLKLRFN